MCSGGGDLLGCALCDLKWLKSIIYRVLGVIVLSKNEYVKSRSLVQVSEKID